MSIQDTAERLDQVRIHLHNALNDLDGDSSPDATEIRRALQQASRQLERIRRRQGQEWANGLLRGGSLK